MARPLWRKGTVLLQTLVMSVILSMMAVMVLKWVLGRYLLASRTFHSATARANAQGSFNTLFVNWYAANTTASNTTPSTTNSMNTQCVHVVLSGGVVTMTANEDADSATCP